MSYADSNFMRPVFSYFLMSYMFKIWLQGTQAKVMFFLKKKIQPSQYSVAENSNKNTFTVNNHILQNSQHTKVR